MSNDCCLFYCDTVGSNDQVMNQLDTTAAQHVYNWNVVFPTSSSVGSVCSEQDRLLIVLIRNFFSTELFKINLFRHKASFPRNGSSTKHFKQSKFHTLCEDVHFSTTAIQAEICSFVNDACLRYPSLHCTDEDHAIVENRPVVYRYSWYYRKRGSASYIVREWLLWVVERETPVTSSISRWNREWSCIWLPRRRIDLRQYASTRCEPVECWKCTDVKTRSLALERSIEQHGRVIDDGKVEALHFAFAGQPAVDHSAAFRWHASSKKNRPSWCLFPFRMAPFLPLRTAWIADILSQASLRNVQRQRYWKRGSETGRDFGTTGRHDWAIFQCRWQASFDAHLNRLQDHRRQPIARSGKFVRRAYLRRALDCAYAFSHRAQCTKTSCWKRGCGDGQRLSLYD